MAINGSGTAADPWIVHDWDELQATIAASTPTGGKYVKLAGDIQAPATGTALEFENFAQIDGDGNAINNLVDTVTLKPVGGNTRLYLQNISFTNVYCDSEDLFDCVVANNNSSHYRLNNVSVSGIFNGATIFKRGDSGYSQSLEIVGMAINAETQNGAFALQRESQTLSFNSVYAKIKYTNCSPQYALLHDQYQTAENCLFNISAENAENNLDIGGKINNCCFIGKGHGAYGISVSYADGVNVVENTLPITVATAAEPYVTSLPTADIKDAQTLHNMGFPIGVD